MAISWTLVWVETPFAGPEISPFSLLQQGVFTISPEGPWQIWVFVGGFVAAGLAAVLVAVFGRGHGLLSLLAGLSPVVLLGDAARRIDQVQVDLASLGVPVTFDYNDFAEAWEVIDDFVRLGVWAYLGGALILLIMGLSLLASGKAAR